MSHIKWDEETIAEHDKLRGTRQKINEPDTPFERTVKPIDEDADDATGRSVASTPHKEDISQNWEALNAKLTFEAQKQKEKDDIRDYETSIGEYTGSGTEGDDEAKKQSFADKRAAHYNEYLVLKAMRQKMDDEDDDEDDA